MTDANASNLNARKGSQEGWRRVRGVDNPPAFEPGGAGCHKPQGQRKQPMLHAENAGGKRVLIVAGQHGHGTLRDDRPRIHVFAHEMHGRPRHPHAGFKRLGMRMKPPEGRQQRRMDVELAAGPFAHERRANAAA